MGDTTTRVVSETGIEAIDKAIAIFMDDAQLQDFHTEDGAHGQCNEASDQFTHVLAELGIKDVHIEHYEPNIHMDRGDYPYKMSGCSWHWAVRIGEWIIDWTARQFEPEAPFPAVWKGEKRKWRNA